MENILHQEKYLLFGINKMFKRKIHLDKADKYLLKSFCESKWPDFIKNLDVAYDIVDFLDSMCNECLHGVLKLSYSIELIKEDEDEINDYLEKHGNQYDLYFRDKMKLVYNTLLKYYNLDGNAKL